MSARTRLPLFLLLSGCALLLHGGWIHAKAMLAQALLERSWQLTLQDARSHRPWPWADHWPVARLQWPQRDLSAIVLEGDSGAVLAFAPGHTPTSGLPGDGRTSIISGHRDTHFKHLALVEPGEEVILQTPTRHQRYTVKQRLMVDSREHQLAIRADNRLVLVTCWPDHPLDSRGPMRLVLVADPASPVAW